MRVAVAAVRQTRRHSVRYFGTKEKVEWGPVPPTYTLDSVQPPEGWGPLGEGEAVPDPGRYVRNPVTSAHAIDTKASKISARDSAAFSPSGTVVHGRYGDLGPDVAEGIPLEYLALLYPAAEGAAALRVISKQAKADKGTLLVYGASQPSAMAAVQLATAEGHAVVAVVGGEHAGNGLMVDCIKGMAAEPGTAVPEEYALVKKNFSDLVEATVNGEPDPVMDPDAFLEDFKKNLLDYTKAYPETRPAAVAESYIEPFDAMKMKDRDTFRENIDAYLSQHKPGSPPIDPKRLDSTFTKDQYAVFRSKFNEQTSAVITGDPTGFFNPPQIVSDLIHSPEKMPDKQVWEGEYIPYDFNIFKATTGVPPRKGGPIMGAILAVTPGLEVAAAAVDKAGPSLREKAEALQFLSQTQRNAYAAATSVVKLAKQNNAPVYVVGGPLRGFETVEPTDDDVQEALAAMEIDEKGESSLNFFVQVYRASDYPVYADYAIHRATEVLSGPRQMVVTK